VWGENEVPIYLCTWHVLEVWRLWSREKIKDSEVRCAILDDLHAIMYMPIELGENIDVFKSRGRNKIIKSFTQHLAIDS
jgi:hypothetical protein